MKAGNILQLFRPIGVRALPCMVMLATCLVLDGRAGSIRGTKHDLSVRGPGPTKSAKERQVCIFCHTPHGSSHDAPLWNRYSSGATYNL